MRPRPVLRPVGALVALTVLAACTSDPGPAPPDPAPAPPVFDCEAVGRAEQDLDARGAAELERLGLEVDDPQALTVTVVAAGTGAPAYWASLQQALGDDAPATLAADVALVRDYWSALEPELAAVRVVGAEPASVRAAGQQLSDIAGSAPDGALAPAQDRVEAAVRTACG